MCVSSIPRGRFQSKHSQIQPSTGVAPPTHEIPVPMYIVSLRDTPSCSCARVPYRLFAQAISRRACPPRDLSYTDLNVLCFVPRLVRCHVRLLHRQPALCNQRGRLRCLAGIPVYPCILLSRLLLACAALNHPSRTLFKQHSSFGPAAHTGQTQRLCPMHRYNGTGGVLWYIVHLSLARFTSTKLDRAIACPLVPSCFHRACTECGSRPTIPNAARTQAA